MPSTGTTVPPMSPMKLGGLIAGILFTATKTLLLISEGLAREELVPPKLGAMLSIGCTVSWVIFVVAHCRDQVRADITALHMAVGDYGDQRAEDARVDTIRAFNRSGIAGSAPPPRHGHMTIVG